MRIFTIFLLFFISSFGDDFITRDEYMDMLYQNPRGIGCHKCHGLKGEGKILAKYYENDINSTKKIKKNFVAPRINDLNLTEFKKGINSSKGIMPRYFLTDEEVVLLFEYLQKFKKDKK